MAFEHALIAPCELQETNSEFVVRVNLPGVPEKDIKVIFQRDSFTIHGEGKEQKTEAKGERFYTERAYGSFTRTINVPSPVKPDNIRARLRGRPDVAPLAKAQKTTTSEIVIEHVQ